MSADPYEKDRTVVIEPFPTPANLVEEINILKEDVEDVKKSIRQTIQDINEIKLTMREIANVLNKFTVALQHVSGVNRIAV
jgi:regulator of replication initiation timing